ncbi:MAG: EAL domain-containing protein [Rhodocyclaceae bacterium]|jgi:diguanylate cyclase (GGDEF)-like protein|nr:EAL domain-containing protein [Rhodocyclaceae bacterium]
MMLSTDDTRILIIDDDALTRALLVESLGEAGFQMVEAADGESGLAAFDAERPDVVLLDVMMPGIDGFEVCRRLRQHPRRGRVPVIMLTGLDDTRSIERAYDSGATDFIAKPINWVLLRYRIGYVLRAATALEELIRSERNLTSAQQIARMGSWEWSLESDDLRHSDGYFRIFGEDSLTFGDGLEAFLARVYPPDRPRVEEALTGARKGRGYQQDYRIVRPDGLVRTVHETAVVLTDPAGLPVSVQGTLQDVSERVEAETRIRYLAFFDDLTGLPNRACFREMLQGALLRTARRGTRCGVILLDVERFARVNESLGQEAGDQALQLIAARLREFQRSVLDAYVRTMIEPETPRVARMGGDAFAMLVEDAPDADEVESQIHRLLGRLKRPFHVAGQELTLSARVGFTLAPDHGTEVESLLKAAESAVSEARRGGSGQGVQAFTEAMKIAAYARLSTENDLRRAVAANELRLFYQPKVDARDGRLLGAEALVRWQHPARGLLPPGEFIPLAEETGLIGPLSDWVLDQALAFLARCRDQGLAPLPISVNLCAAQFRSDKLVADLAASLARHGLPGHLLEIEVTESILMKDVDLASAMFAAIADQGIRISIDDFGTGYSSLAYLKRFRVHTLKIDRSFVRDLEEGGGDAAIVGAIIALAGNLGMGVIAEGVEEPAQASILLERGCSHMQGYYFARPLPEEAYREVLSQGLPNLRRDDWAFDPVL